MTAAGLAPVEVRWVPPARSHKERLKAFCCCEPEEKTRPYGTWRHSKEWELDAQSFARQDLPMPPRPPDFVVIAEDANGSVLAVSYFDHDRDFAQLAVVAVALGAKGQGLGKEAIRRTIDRITERAIEQGEAEVLLECRIDPRNAPSIALMSKFGFAKQLEPDLEYDNNGYSWEEGEVVLDLWTSVLPIPNQDR